MTKLEEILARVDENIEKMGRGEEPEDPEIISQMAEELNEEDSLTYVKHVVAHLNKEIEKQQLILNELGKGENLNLN